MSSKYDSKIDLSDRNSSHTLKAELVGTGRRVLDVGCDNGSFGRALKERGCWVAGVEIDPTTAEEARQVLDQVEMADLEEADLTEVFGPASFDVVVFGDVLEHLRDPLPVLRRSIPLLRAGGYVVASIPNVAHGSVRLSLLKGEFEYSDVGLLDATHLRFFTKDTLEELFADAGLVPTELLRVTAGFFDTELGVRPEDYNRPLLRKVENDPEATTYQFVVKAVVDDAEHSIRSLREREQAARAEAEALRAELAAAPARTRERRVIPGGVGEGAAGTDGAHETDGSGDGQGGREALDQQLLPRCRVGIMGPFDLGDLRHALLLRITRAELGRRLPGSAFRFFSPFGYHRPNPRGGGEPMEPLGSSTATRAGELAGALDCLVVTGELASGPRLAASYAARYGDVGAPGDGHHPAELLSAGLGPDLERNCPVIWSGVSLAGDTDDKDLAALADVVAARPWGGAVVDDELMMRLRTAGAGAATVVPDPAFLASRLFDGAVLGRRADYLRALRWLPPAPGRALIVQGSAELAGHAGGVAAALSHLLATRTGLTVVVAELEPDQHDGEFADALSEALPTPCLRLPADVTVEDVLAAVAAGAGYIGTSPTALAMSHAFGRPYVGIDLSGSGHLQQFVRSTGSPQHVVRRVDDLVAAFESAPSPELLLMQAGAVQGLLDTHFDRVASTAWEAARRRGGDGTDPASFDPDYVAALEAANGAMQRRLVAERALLARPPVEEAEREDRILSLAAGRLLMAEAAQARAELELLQNTRTLRMLRPARDVYTRLRSRWL